MLNPVAMAIIANTFADRAERARAIGVFGSVSGISLGLGPVLGGMSGDPSLALARDMLAWLYLGDAPLGEFSQRDAHRQFRERDGHATTAEEIGAALRLLGMHGYIRPLPAPPKSSRGGRPASPRYEVCPVTPDTTDRTRKTRGNLR